MTHWKNNIQLGCNNPTEKYLDALFFDFRPMCISKTTPIKTQKLKRMIDLLGWMDLWKIPGKIPLTFDPTYVGLGVALFPFSSIDGVPGR